MSERFHHKKSLGQHFLTSPVVPGWMCDAAALKEGDRVLEIGPGTGALTAELLARGTTVVALEADQRAIVELEERFADELSSGQLTIQHGDARTIDPTALTLTDQGYKIVANIPYYLSGLLFRQCLSATAQPTDIVFLVQKEVAKRATANHSRGEKESLLSLSIQAYGEPKYVKAVGRGHFVPPPAVDSAIIAIHHISRNHFTQRSETDFFHLLKLGFGQKRKQLLGNLAHEYDRTQLTHIFSTLGLSITIRAEDVPLKIWLQLVDALYTPT